MSEDRFGFEEITYLLLFGKLPMAAELQAFTQQLSEYRTLPTNFRARCHPESAQSRYDEHWRAACSRCFPMTIIL